MKNSFNKGTYGGLITIIIVLIIIVSCNKSFDKDEPMPKPNSPLTIHSSDLIDIRGSDVFTTNDSLQRRIEIINRSNDSISDVFYITLRSSDFVTNIYTQLKNKTFTGTLTIVNGKDILFLREVKNGVNIVANPINHLNEKVSMKSNDEKNVVKKSLKRVLIQNLRI